jgi:hypothetical protein
MVTPGQAAGDRPTRVTGAAIGDPPFAALCLSEIAADRTWESNGTWRRNRLRIQTRCPVILCGCLGRHARAPIGSDCLIASLGKAPHAGYLGFNEKAPRSEPILASAAI